MENDKDSFGYGYLFWGGRENTFRADGKYCQWSIISREKNAVITVIAECRRDQELMDAGVYGGISAGINGYIWKMKVSRKTESVFASF